MRHLHRERELLCNILNRVDGAALLEFYILGGAHIVAFMLERIQPLRSEHEPSLPVHVDGGRLLEHPALLSDLRDVYT
jgi:hypothetical protein